MSSITFNLDCQQCPRLAKFLVSVKQTHPDYHARPVPAFGVAKPKLLVVGLAPGMHGANATGRPFTGDYAGILLYQTLYKFGFSNKAESVALKDGLKLINCRITNAVKCLPPNNKPIGVEVNTCNAYLKNELAELQKGTVLIAIGGLAHKSIIKALELKQKDFVFKHNQRHRLNDKLILLDSYHCSRYNTSTKRLTEKMFHDVFRKAKKILES